MERYEHIQKTTALRNQNSIKAYKILDIQGKRIFFQLWLNSDEKGSISISMPEEYEIGQYVDMQVIRHSKTNYSVKLIGATPKAFIPADGRAIAV